MDTDRLNLCNSCIIDVEDMGAPDAVLDIIEDDDPEACEACAKDGERARLVWLEGWAAA